jgi:NADPH:quinone reductase-like Zn-dependent oxidoreductase
MSPIDSQPLMRAAWYERKGAAREVLQVGELPVPEPGPGEVRVRVAVSAINPSDAKGRTGWRGQTDMPFPRIIPHQDGSGVIDAVGAVEGLFFFQHLTHELGFERRGVLFMHNG